MQFFCQKKLNFLSQNCDLFQKLPNNFSGKLVTGEYSLKEPTGNVRTVQYEADEDGFRAIVSNSQSDVEDPTIVPKAVPVAAAAPVHVPVYVGSYQNAEGDEEGDDDEEEEEENSDEEDDEEEDYD